MPTYVEPPSALLAAMERSVKDPVKKGQVTEVATKLASHGGGEFVGFVVERRRTSPAADRKTVHPRRTRGRGA